MTKVLSFGRAVPYPRGMITARLRLFLAILALVLVPLWAPAQAAAPMAMAVQNAQPCDHDCGAETAPAHADAACALGCLQASLPPLMLPQAVEALPDAVVLRQPPVPVRVLSATSPPPPVRPPRA